MPPMRVCYACERTFETPRARCDCGEPLWRPIEPLESCPSDAGSSGRSIWRYDAVLPASQPTGDLEAGGAAVWRSRSLESYAGANVWLADEGRNPTGSFKDRGSAVGVAATLEAGIDRVGTVSHGNMASSVAAHAAAAGIDCTVLVPADIAEERIRAIARFDPQIVRVHGDYGRLYYDALELGRRHGIQFLNSDVPLRVAGQKTLAFDLLETVPSLDAIVLPVSSGGNASAVWKGLLELRAGGLLESLPRLYLIQAAACDPIAAAYRSDRERVDPASGVKETVAYSIANADPPSGTRALAAVRDTDGAALSVDDDAILEAQDRLARDAGVRVEPASATTVAGLRRLTERGDVGPDETVACVLTGRGYGGEGELPSAPVVDREDLESSLDSE
ncbi:threonine synthase [Natronosalvus halobius]|uniref:threonine synthase n=1 Tax=Natronosalvus halobius TaxID=2953746 RepID=UPI003CCD95DE